jgi:hypothetical protein
MYVEDYDDGRVALTDRDILIRRYYTWRNKRIDYDAILEVREVPLAAMGWRVKEHGSDDNRHWFNADPNRSRKVFALVIYLDEKIRPVITPDDPDLVISILTAHGVKVTISQGEEYASGKKNR